MMEKMEDTFREFDTELNEQFGARLGMPIDVEETDETIVVRADLPGVEKDNIAVTANEDAVNIRAHDDREVKEEGKNYIRQERRTQQFNRTVTLPANIDPDSAEAEYDQGVLTVTLEKSSAGSGTDVEVK